jgi:hypothetical protein
MKAQLHFIGAPRAAQHKVFFDNPEEAKAFDPEAFFDCPRELLGRAYNRPRRAQLEGAAAAPAPDPRTAAKMERCVAWRAQASGAA